jgi:hypothetical protein
MSVGRVWALSIFRASHPGEPNQKVEALYGNATHPYYHPDTDTFTMEPNRLTGQQGTFGTDDFGNSVNYYTWTTWTFKNKLYFGTFDGSTFAADLSVGLLAQPEWLDLNPTTQAVLHSALRSFKDRDGGGDVWRFDKPGQPAVAEDLHGLGNRSNHGIRVVNVLPDKVIVGTANEMNLRSGSVQQPGRVADLKPHAQITGALPSTWR